MTSLSYFYHLALPLGLILVLPLSGAYLAGQDLSFYLAFPPRPDIRPHAAFSLAVFILILIFTTGSLLPFFKQAVSYKKKAGLAAFKPFPWWGWLSLAALSFFWFIAWTRFDLFKSIQAHTFFPIWLGFIFLVNALICRTGRQPLTSDPFRLTLLFVVSAGFWWLFEYLNRFVGNWYYTGAQYPAVEYFLLATLSFSTVLPAVESVKSLLLTTDLFKNGFRQMTAFPWLGSRIFGWALTSISSILLILIPAFPDPLFFLVWICPVFIFSGISIGTGRAHVFKAVETGDYTLVAAYAAAALICGFFWELFNYYSLAKWHYQIPYVQWGHLFEMPILGYAGYLPFGLECAVVIDLVMPFSGRAQK